MQKSLFSMVALVVIGALGIASPSPAAGQTNGYQLQCLSARTAGQGCVNRAQSDSPVTLFRDPAGITRLEPSTLEVDLALFTPLVSFRNATNPDEVTAAVHSYPLISAAYVGRNIGSRLSWAIGLEPFGGFGADFELKQPLLSEGAQDNFDYESFFAALKLGPTLAYELTPGLSVGGSVSLLYGVMEEFRMPFTIPPSLPEGLPALAQLDPDVYGPLFQQFTEVTAFGTSEDYSGFGWTADVGVRYDTPGGISVAASWTPERPLTVDGGTALIDLSTQFAVMLEAMIMARAQAYGETQAEAQGEVMAQLASAGLDTSVGVAATYDASAELTLPMTVGAGTSVPLTSTLRLAAEVEWRQWSDAMFDIPFRLTDGDNRNLNLLMNADPTDATFTYFFPLRWEDTWTVKGGVEYVTEGGWALRGGYLYGENPVPSRTIFAAFPAVATDAVTAGTSFALGSLPVDVSLTHAFKNDVVGVNEGHLLGSEYLGSESGLSETVVTFGARWRL